MATSLDPSAIFSQLFGGYMKLPLVQKIVFPLLVAGCVSGIIYVSKWANQPDYAILYSDLEPADASAVVEQLKSQKVKYEVRGDGDTIAISPPDMVHELRISLASEGIPKGGVVGLEIFDAANLGTTTFQEKIKFQRAIQGELERTIGAVQGITSARVHITQPEKTVFSKNGSVPTASVLLKLRPGTQLEKKQIKGITNLVAGSVEGLKPENVSIIDVYGNLLNEKEEGPESMNVEATRLQYQHELERGYVKHIEEMLAKVMGPGKVIARVSADLDFSQTEREEESYDPGSQVVRSERSIEEGASEAARGGVPGVVSNLSNDPNLLAPSGGAKVEDRSSRREAVKNYEVSRAVSKVSSPRGKLIKLSVAVLVDGTYEKPAAASGAAAPAAGETLAQTVGTYKPLEPQTMAQIESVVKSAVGYDAARGDAVTVENIPFHVSEDNFVEEMNKKETQDLIFNVIYRAGPLIFLFLFFFVIVRPLVRFLITPTEAEVDLSRLLPTGIQELEKELETERSKVAIPAYEPAIDIEQLEELMSENSRLVKENPQQAALLIRYWLNDGRL
ncbi:MAG: flagellar M-ring protein FliF [Oligoflexia bacterium]|nr:flagellar M-ring protein FliF [Oligoflexia bacterium]